MSNWNPCPFDTSDYDYPGGELEQHWDRLHAGDRIEFPSPERVRTICDTSDMELLTGEQTHDSVAALLQDAWRSFHKGDFEEAVQKAVECGPVGLDCASKATGIYATHLEADPAAQQELFRSAISLAEKAINALPFLAGSHYFRAFNLGRLGQSLSITEALKLGMAGKISESLTRALEIEPHHGEAHIAMGMYHAEIVAKVGKLVAGITYGAKADKAIEHFETALALIPDSPVAHSEFGNGLYLLFGDKRLDDVTDLYIRASELEPADAMERLDVEAAAAELE